MNAARLRFAAGLVTLAALAFFAVSLTPVYWRNHRFQQSLQEIVLKGPDAGDDALRAAVVASAGRLRLPVAPGQIRIRRSGSGMEVEVRYLVPVDLSLYSVNLHFRPKARR